MPDFTCLDRIRARRPLIHCVSNIVSANDCANLVLAAGAGPIMAHAPEEAADITAASAAVVLNTGTPDEARFRTCLLCGKEAARLGRPVVLDPVGVGASPWRLERVGALLESFPVSILRVNLGEARALTGGGGGEAGVDSPAPASLEERADAALALARRYRAAVLLTGPEDLVADGESVQQVFGGSPRMTSVTGTGCMLSALCGVFAAVEPAPMAAALLASAFWKTCARRAEERAGGRGPGSFRTALLDAAGTLTAADLAAETDAKTM
ncbi:hydroxyethylthiazole kinase [Oscillibacter sp. 1-3]|uniref:hydroxyethylthiazole kinase n=1 Tax=Oscillibacter sp. 1-3 TaxID=1235797 RepID=UPI00033750D4|nr:hydroxyethylthiazole kinase [Oscillibacter sp. 1-3]EOS65410.1 hydroxyethylthiazole kinase [Oscillibacter sp. 1-3]MCI9511400.1 hydroxyethylthiazole kinase [Oscillibacter sp.]